MNKREHVINGVLVGVGIGIIFAAAGSPTTSLADLSTLRTIVAVTVPVVLGAMGPDIDAVIGSHRKTLHNLLVLAGFIAFPAVFGNLRFVWIGVLTHYLLDLLGSKRGIALFYPIPNEHNPFIGVSVGSRYAGLVTVLISCLEIVVGYAIVNTAIRAGISLTHCSDDTPRFVC
jgi:membrane-bound metal-dependent hydrolase YbcI (DUF457 family)